MADNPVSRRSWLRATLAGAAGLLGLGRLTGRPEPESLDFVVEVGWTWWSHAVIPTPDFAKVSPKWDYESARHFLEHFHVVGMPLTGNLTFPDPITGEPQSVRIEPDERGGHRVLLVDGAEVSLIGVSLPPQEFPIEHAGNGVDS